MTGSVSPPSGARSTARFIGRERELAELRAGLDDAIAGRGRLFLISGEPGVGKTRLAEEISSDAAARGMRVLWGRCWEGGGAPAYWPLIQILRACVEDRDSAHLEALLGSSASEIARLIPELKLSLPSLEETKATTDSESARFLLFDAVATLLKNVARGGPLLIVIDDLHDADQPSLLMMRFIARAAKDVSLPMIGTYRDAEVKRSPPLGKLVGDLIREGRSLSLTGLSKTEVGDFLASRTGRTADERLVADLYRATDGNALYVEGVVRLLESEGRLEPAANARDGFRIPDGVRESIRRQLAALSDEANSLLSIASVIGNEFEMRLLERVSGHSPEQIVEQTDEAVRIGVLKTGAPGFARQQFSHALIREVYYDDLAANRRIELHGDIGAAIEEIHKDDLPPHLAALAHHFREAGDTDKAIDYSIAAGEAANASYAYEEADFQWRTAVRLLERDPARRELRATVLRSLGRAMIHSKPAKGVDYFEQAIRLYEDLHQPAAAAELHIDVGFLFSGAGTKLNIPRSLAHLRAAEALLGANPTGKQAASLYQGIAWSHSRAMRNGEGLAAARRALELSETLGDDDDRSASAATAYGLHLFYAGRVADGQLALDRAWESAERSSRSHTIYFGVAWIGGELRGLLYDWPEARLWYARELKRPTTARARWQSGFLNGLLGEAYALDGHLDEARECLRKVPPGPYWLAFIGLFEGEWEQADAMWTGFQEEQRQGGARNEGLVYFRFLVWLCRLLGQHARAEALLQEALALCDAEQLAWVEMWARPELALLYAETGRSHEARPHVSRCREIMAAGEDWRGLGGTVERADAVITAARGKLDLARVLFDNALSKFRRYPAPWEDAETNYHWGRALNAAGDYARANEKLDAAIEIYRRCGAGERWVQRVEADRPQRSAPSPSQPEGGQHIAGAQGDAVFAREGDYWTVAYEGKTWRLKDAKGFHYIAHLIGHPGEEIRALDLVARIAGGRHEVVDSVSAEDFARSDTLAGDLGHAGEILDAQAKTAYGRRLTELKDELEEARELGNAERAEQAQDEIEALGRELKGAIGLAGRDRYAASSTERARIAVTRAIHHALSKIAENDASLGKLLSTTIKTGTACSYVPDLRFPISWQLSLNAERARSSR